MCELYKGPSEVSIKAMFTLPACGLMMVESRSIL